MVSGGVPPLTNELPHTPLSFRCLQERRAGGLETISTWCGARLGRSMSSAVPAEQQPCHISSVCSPPPLVSTCSMHLRTAPHSDSDPLSCAPWPSLELDFLAAVHSQGQKGGERWVQAWEGLWVMSALLMLKQCPEQTLPRQPQSLVRW